MPIYNKSSYTKIVLAIMIIVVVILYFFKHDSIHSMSPDQPYVQGELTMLEKSVSMSSEEVPSAQITFKLAGQEKSVWVDQGQSADVLGYRVEVKSVDLAEGNVSFSLKKIK